MYTFGLAAGLGSLSRRRLLLLQLDFAWLGILFGKLVARCVDQVARV
jgi:hypothetical protein